METRDTNFHIIPQKTLSCSDTYTVSRRSRHTRPYCDMDSYTMRLKPKYDVSCIKHTPDGITMK